MNSKYLRVLTGLILSLISIQSQEARAQAGRSIGSEIGVGGGGIREYSRQPAPPEKGLSPFTIGNPTPEFTAQVQGQGFTPAETGAAGSGAPTGDASGNVVLTSFTIAFADGENAPENLYIYDAPPNTDEAAAGTGSLGVGVHAGDGVYEFPPGLEIPLCTESFAVLPGSRLISHGPNAYFAGADIFPAATPPAQIVRGGFDIGFTATFLGAGVVGASSCSQANLAQFGNGDGAIRSEILLTNPSPERTAIGEIDIYDENGARLDLRDHLSGTVGVDLSGSSPAFRIAPLGSIRIGSDGQGPLSQGSVAVRSNFGLGSLIRFEIAGIGVAGVGAAPALTRALAPVQRVAGGINTGLAIRNVSGTEAVMVSLTLIGLEGNVVAGGIGALMLGPNARDACFIEELFPDADTEDFQGAVAIASSLPVAVIALELGQAGQFTTLPVTEIP